MSTRLHTYRAVTKGFKTFTTTVDCSASNNAKIIAAKSGKAIFKDFSKMHDKTCNADNIKIKLTIYSYDTMLDMRDFSPKANATKLMLEQLGMELPVMSIKHKRSRTLKLVYEVSFIDRDPLGWFAGSSGWC